MPKMLINSMLSSEEELPLKIHSVKEQSDCRCRNLNEYAYEVTSR